MNQILVADVEYVKNLNASRLRENLRAIKNAIIVLLIQCIILVGMLGYKVYSSNQDENNNNNLLAMAQDNTVVNESALLNEDYNNIEIANINNEIIESNLVTLTSDSASKIKSKEYQTANGESYSIIARLNIPSLNINMNVLSKTSNALLKVSLNKYWGGNPNEVGNLCIVGHNYENGTHFSNLEKIKIGDIIELTDSTGRTLQYTAYKTDVIDPYDTSCTSQLTNGATEITLITCYNSGKQRFYVKARA